MASPRPKVLVVDDEPAICELIRITLSRMQLGAVSSGTIADAKLQLEKGLFDLCLTDLRLPDGDGIELVEHIQLHYPDLPVAVITAFATVEKAVDALKAGAFDLATKPIRLDQLRSLVKTALNLPKNLDHVEQTSALIGNSDSICHLRDLIAKFASKDAPIFIYGNSGTGKELVARTIHWRSARRDHAFVAVNCSAIPAELVESELFGHLKGSFTGAVADKEGLFQASNHGSLFLDEIADLPLPSQAKLLRALQERVVRPVGSTREVPVDVRLITATHQNLDDLVRHKRFRQDLYYRVNVLRIHTPDLRDIPEDIPLLIDSILRDLGPHFQSFYLTEEALATLTGYAFPGNVRELRNIIERAAATAQSHEISAADLGIAAGVPQVSPDSPTVGPISLDTETLPDMIARVEKAAIESALLDARFNKTAAAKRLGISFRSLRYKLAKLGIK